MSGTLSSAQLSLWREGPIGEPDWTLRQSTRSRRLSVRIHHGGRVEVVVPQGMGRPQVLAFLQRHREWIDRRCERAQRMAPPADPFPPASLQLSAIDQQWRVHLAGGRGSLRAVPAAQGLLAVRGEGDRGAQRDALVRWLCGLAQVEFGARLRAIAAETGHEFARLQIRRQRSRWGSCSTRGTISLNCALLFQPPEVLRYLLIHELVHTVHMNHSPRYWAEVARLEPRYRELDRELLAGWTRVPAWLLATRGALH